ncbi:hypothetical protein J6590_108446 [Homalodisca vitripennis]|nr:hypothetical protein J6590_108446 [Homalodisca vitripennis]
MSAKVMKPPCTCRMKCSEAISEEERKSIFSSYWKEETSIDVKRQFVSSCILCLPTMTSRKRNLNSDKGKENTLYYHFSVNNKKIRVCKTFFLNTLSISNKVVVNILKTIQQGGVVKPDQRGKKTPPNKTPEATMENIKHHISLFPSYESHYSREKSNKKYLGPELNVDKMYELYVAHCKENDIDDHLVAGKWLYRDVFNKHFKLSFKAPEIDTCDLCDAFQAKLKGDLNTAEKASIKSEYNDHLTESVSRYDLKNIDTKTAQENPNHKVLTGDLQKCLATPLITSGLSFYKRKLWTLNFTLYDSSDSSVHCVMWDETKGARGGNEIASALLKWADEVLPGTQVDEITIWTDNCYGQNKNKAVLMCFFWILKKYPQLNKITQKFLLKGHTHMEADTVHALIERKRKKTQNMTILTPWDWQQLVRQTSNKYQVHNMEVEDFKNFETLLTGKTSPFVSRKIDVEKMPFFISQTVLMEVRQGNMGKLFLKTSFVGEYREVDFVRHRRNQDISWPEDLQCVTKDRLPINKNKYTDLMSLLPLIPTACHDFYRNLPHTNNAPEYPRDDPSDTTYE